MPSRIPRTCRTCSVYFEARRPTHIYCSRSCHAAIKTKSIQVELICERCKKHFRKSSSLIVSSGGKIRFCDRNCYVADSRETARNSFLVNFWSKVVKLGSGCWEW